MLLFFQGPLYRPMASPCIWVLMPENKEWSSPIYHPHPSFPISHSRCSLVLLSPCLKWPNGFLLMNQERKIKNKKQMKRQLTFGEPHLSPLPRSLRFRDLALFQCQRVPHFSCPGIGVFLFLEHSLFLLSPSYWPFSSQLKHFFREAFLISPN